MVEEEESGATAAAAGDEGEAEEEEMGPEEMEREERRVAEVSISSRLLVLSLDLKLMRVSMIISEPSAMESNRETTSKVFTTHFESDPTDSSHLPL